MQKNFSQVYQELNAEQRKAVDTIYGPVLVIAWPWSGKTQLLSARIANILQTTDYLPSNILCLTFTENAAHNMRTRLASIIGADAYRVAIHTFHSFGNEILGRYRYLFRDETDANVIDDIAASRILDAILTPLPWDHPYKPRMRASETINDIRSTINNLKKWGITPLLYREIIQQNTETLQMLAPILQEAFLAIDSLGRKKEDNIQKMELFQKMTDIVRKLPENGKRYGNMDTLLATITRWMEEVLNTQETESDTKPLTLWKKNWTELDSTGNRILKEQSKLEKQQAFADIYDAYQTRLETDGYIDFSDMIIRATEIVEQDPMIQANLAEQYQFILIDEYQDTNEAQMRLIQSILSVSPESPNIFAVGDDDQSIYKFQWANIKNIREFHDAWPDTELIILRTNYRSYDEIIHASRKTLISDDNRIAQIFPGTKKILASSRWSGGMITKKSFSNEFQEMSSIVTDIVEKISAGTPPQNIAIITKKNKSLEPFAKLLLAKGISVNMSRTESIWESELISLIVNILRYLHSLTERETAHHILVDILAHPAWGIPRLELWKVARDIYHARKEENKDWIEQLATASRVEIRDTAYFLKELANMSEYVRLEDLIDTITGANTLTLSEEHDEDVQADQLQIDMMGGGRKNYTSPLYAYFFGQIWMKNWSKWEASTQKARHLANMKCFIDKIRSFKGSKPLLLLEDAIELLDLIEYYDIPIETSQLIGNAEHAVNLTTIHKAKGLEWEHVYVPFLHKREYKLGKVGGSILPKNLPLEAEKDDDEDIERLIYTAFTRAKDTLTLSFSALNHEERTNEALAMIGAEDEDWEGVASTDTDILSEALEIEKKDLYSLPYIGEESDFLQDRIEKTFTMNATALQAFLNVADHGPEFFVGNNILRFPQAKNIAGCYGSAIHAALETFFEDYQHKKTFQKSLLYSTFEKNFKKEGFPPDQETEWLSRGKDNLEALYAEISRKTYGELTMEKDFRTESGGIFLTNTDGTEAIQLTGKIDRIERLSDDTLIVTDYKTGKGFIDLGDSGQEYEKIKKWKYRLQLCFYAILFELSPRYRMFPKKQFELFFVEKNADGSFYRVTEYIQQTEIERTKDLIRAVMRKIRNLDFPDTRHYEPTMQGIRQFEEDLLNWQI